MNLEGWIVLLTVLACVFGLGYSFYHYWIVSRIRMRKRRQRDPQHPRREASDSEDSPTAFENREKTIGAEGYDNLVAAGDVIANSATVYLLEEYAILAAFILIFGLLLYVR